MRDQSFFARVYDLVARVPRGKVVTYGQLAAFLGHPRAARTVGWAMHAAPRERNLSCHRVVNAEGALAPDSVFGGAARQRARLVREGVTFRANCRIDLERHRWRITDT